MQAFMRTEQLVEKLMASLSACQRQMMAETEELNRKWGEEEEKHNHDEGEPCDDDILQPIIDPKWAKLGEVLGLMEEVSCIHYNVLTHQGAKEYKEIPIDNQTERDFFHGINFEDFPVKKEKLDVMDIKVERPDPGEKRPLDENQNSWNPKKPRFEPHRSPLDKAAAPLSHRSPLLRHEASVVSSHTPGFGLPHRGGNVNRGPQQPDSSSTAASGMVVDTDNFADLEDFTVHVYNFRTQFLHLSVPQVRDFFQREFGRVAHIKLLGVDKFSYISCQFNETETVERVLASRPIFYGKHPLFVQQRDRSQMNRCNDSRCQVFLPDLMPKFKEQELLPLFSCHGEVVDLQIREGPRGVYGIVQYASPEQVRTVVKHHVLHTDSGDRIFVKPFNQNRAPKGMKK